MDITISSPTEWVSVNSLTSISAGTALILQNKGAYEVIVQASSSKPDTDSLVGVIMTPLANPYAEKETETGDDEIWIRPITYGRKIFLNVQEA